MNAALFLPQPIGWSMIWETQEDYRGFGVATSSQCLSLIGAVISHVMSGKVDLGFVEQSARQLEQLLAGGHEVAANDVKPILEGNAILTLTDPQQSGLERVSFRRVPCSEIEVAKHLLLAVRRNGKRHSVASLLPPLFRHPEASRFVREISCLAKKAAEALTRNDFPDLARLVNVYRKIFDRWTDRRFTSEVNEIARRLEAAFGPGLGWKPPGAGACPSLVLVAESPEMQGRVLAFLEADGWEVQPVTLSSGLSWDGTLQDGTETFSAPMRIDLIGAADLGLDPAIGVPGRCLALAIAPRAKLLFRIGLDLQAPAARGCQLAGQPPFSPSEIL